MEPLPEEPPQRPPIAQAPLSVILIATGSTSDTVESVSGWQAYLATLDRLIELLLVPLAPIESNPMLADVRRLECDPALGYGAALEAALRAAQHPLAVLATADHQYQPADLNVLLGVIDKVDIAVGCRRVAPRPWWWRAIGTVFGWIGWVLVGLPALASPCTPGATPLQRRWAASWLFGVRLHDPECAFRLARRSAMTRIVLQSRGPFALVEQLAKANHLEMIMTEEPVAWTPRAESASFAQEAWALFRRPDFGPPELHVPPPLPAEKREPPPTTPPSASSELAGESQNEE
jgi:Glycosyl transferase family 2